MNASDEEIDESPFNETGNLKGDYNVTPWQVDGVVDYNKIVQDFGTRLITPEIIEKLRMFTGQIHPLLSRGFFFSHRDFDKVLDAYKKGENFYLYTGRGPSGHVHMGHLMPWFFTKYLQDTFRSRLLFQITDDEKFLYSQHLSSQEVERYAYDNILDVIAMGFDPKLTRIIIDTKDIKALYPLYLEISKRLTFSTAKAVFGYRPSSNVGMISFPAIQAAPCFLPSLIEQKPTRVLIPAAIDQDPYWRITRDVAEKMGYYKPAQVHSKFVPSLEMNGKMSSSKPNSAIFTTDDPETIENKISGAYTGGQPSVGLQRMLGGDPDACPVFWYLSHFFDNGKVSFERSLKCRTGNLLCGECKSDLAIQTKLFISEFTRRRDQARNQIAKFLYEDNPFD
ncbi:MAG: tryptophan--tRNA ligase [Nitrososphaeraceae archaeon]